MLPTRIFRNRWHALMFAGMICALAAEFASDAPVAVPAGNAALSEHRPSVPANEPVPSPADDAGSGLFASLLAPRDASGPAPRMLSFDTDGDGIPDATAREVR